MIFSSRVFNGKLIDDVDRATQTGFDLSNFLLRKLILFKRNMIFSEEAPTYNWAVNLNRFFSLVLVMKDDFGIISYILSFV